MQYVTRNCPHCGCILAEKERRCPSCGSKVSSSNAAALSSARKCPRCGRIMDAGEHLCPVCENKASSNQVNRSSVARECPSCGCTLNVGESRCPSCGNRSFTNAPAIKGKSFLSTWRTSAGAVIFGAMASYALSSMMGLFEGLVVVVVGIAYLAFVLIYALSIYPSLFTDTPKMSSSDAVSFLNGFVGGVIFGPLWCASLTKGKCGVSQYVLAILLVGGLIAVLMMRYWYLQ